MPLRWIVKIRGTICLLRKRQLAHKDVLLYYLRLPVSLQRVQVPVGGDEPITAVSTDLSTSLRACVLPPSQPIGLPGREVQRACRGKGNSVDKGKGHQGLYAYPRRNYARMERKSLDTRILCHYTVQTRQATVSLMRSSYA